MQSCNHSQPHIELVLSALAILTNICRYRELRPVVCRVKGALQVLAELLRTFRDREASAAVPARSDHPRPAMSARLPLTLLRCTPTGPGTPAALRVGRRNAWLHMLAGVVLLDRALPPQ